MNSSVYRSIDFGGSDVSKVKSKQLMAAGDNNLPERGAALPDIVRDSVGGSSDCESKEQQFGVFSYTQNLSSVLTDPRKSRNEVASFFTRHWGEAFVSKTKISPSPSVPSLNADHFRAFVSLYGKKYRHFTRSRRALQRELNRKSETSPSSLDKPGPSGSELSVSAQIQSELAEIPKIFLDSKFTLDEPETFSCVFMHAAKDSVALNPFADDMPQDQPQMVFRPHTQLRDKLEHYHDLVESRLTQHLASKSRVFFRAVTSHNKLLVQLADTQNATRKLRSQMSKLENSVVQKSIKALSLHRARENCYALLRKLEVVANVREAQMTVQMFLNNYNYPGALDVISTAQAVLQQDLSGIVCFRHLSVQLSELQNVISRMLQEEFVRLIQSEFSKPLEQLDQESPSVDEEQLNAVVLGLLRVREFRFCQVLREEISAAVKSSLRQTIRSCVSVNEHLTEFDSSVGNLGDQMRKMEFEEWLSLLELLFQNLFLFCRKIENLQEILTDLVDIAAGRCLPPSAAPSAEQMHLPKAKHLQCPLTVICDTLLEDTDYVELQNAVSDLTQHATTACQERCSRVLLARAKDNYIERLSAEDFSQLVQRVEDFIDRCDQLAPSKSSPLRSCLHNQANKFVARFHEDRKLKLSNILDSEHWRSAEVPPVFQRMVDDWERTGQLRDLEHDHKQEDGQKTPHHLTVNKQQYVVVGTALLLLQMIAQYCQTVEAMPFLAPDLLIRLVELLKNFNSRTCQLILGAGALQLVGLKTISVKNLALACRCLELISVHIPLAQRHFERHLSENAQNQTRHLVQVSKDYQDHMTEICNKLISVMQHHTHTCIVNWQFTGEVPSPSFQQIGKHLKKFHEGLSGILDNDQIQQLFLRVHDNFKTSLREQLHQLGVDARDTNTYGLVCSEFSYYMQVLRSLPCCSALNDTLSDVMLMN